ncbi:hypothetical protein [Lutimonas sp.]|uniref:hypothetical protein n=1 Tax=Lutimonas sp. TaxID=1872403 RepID=UPI003D9B1BD3
MKKILVFLVVFVLTCQFTMAQEKDKNNPILSEKFFIYAGVFSPFKQVTFGFKATIPEEDDNLIDIDETFDLQGIQSTFNTNFNWRFSKKWSLNSDFFSLRTSNDVILGEDVIWNGYTFKKGTSIEGGYGASVWKIGVGRTLSSGKKHEFRALLGVYLLGLNGFLAGSAFLDGEEIELEKQKVSVTLPLPSIGLSYIYAPTIKLSFFAKVEWFGIKIDDISGSLWDISPGVRYQFFKHIGVNLNYKYLNLFGDVDQNMWKGSFEMEFQGPSLGLIATF